MGDNDDSTESAGEWKATDPFADFRALSEQLRERANEPTPTESAAEHEITSWEDIIEDDSWLNEEWGGAAVETPDPEPQMVAVPDVTGEVYAAMESIFSQPTMDFEIQYQQGHQVYAEAGQRLANLCAQTEAEGIALDDPRAARLLEQVNRLREWNEDFVSKHEEYRALMDPTTGRYGKRIAADRHAAAAKQLQITKDTNAAVSATYATIHQNNVKAAAKRNAEWLKGFTGRSY